MLQRYEVVFAVNGLDEPERMIATGNTLEAALHAATLRARELWMGEPKIISVALVPGKRG